MVMFDTIFWPAAILGSVIGMIIWILLLILWIFMLIDCIKRKFKSDTEKIIWVLVIILTTHIFAIGAIIYYFIVKSKNKH